MDKPFFYIDVLSIFTKVCYNGFRKTFQIWKPHFPRRIM